MRIPAARFSDAARSQVRPITFRVRGLRTDVSTPAPTSAPTGAPTSEPGPVSRTKGDARAHGMLRRLEAGGFNGVADLRHRIRNEDALKERADARAADTFVGSAKGFFARISDATLEALSDVVNDKTARTDVSAALDGFRDIVRDAATEAARTGTIDVDAVATTLREALDGLLNALGDAVAPTDTSAGADPASTSGPVIDVAASAKAALSDALAPVRSPLSPTAPESPRDAADTATGEGAHALAALSSIFAGALDALVGRVSDALELPDPAPAHGNGRAYDKFRAIYATLHGGTDPAVDTSA